MSSLLWVVDRLRLGLLSRTRVTVATFVGLAVRKWCLRNLLTLGVPNYILSV